MQRKSLLSISILILVMGLFTGVIYAQGLEIGDDYTYSTTGPRGEEAVSYEVVQLSENDISSIKSGNYKAAICLHETSTWTNTVTKGIEDMFEELGIEIVAITDAEMNPQSQTTDYETVMALQPDIIITLPIDTVSAAASLRPIVNRGVELVFISNVPQGLEHGKDYAGIVTDDFFEMGKYVAEMMGNYLDGEGKVALMYHDANYYITNQRDKAVKAVLQRDFPNIEIVTEEGIVDPNDGDVVASAILTQHPDIDAIYAPWDTIAEGVLSAVRTEEREDIGIFTIDIGNSNALNMARGGNIKGIVSDLPYVLGETLAKMGALRVLEKETPPFVVVPSVKINQNNLREMWEEVLHEPVIDQIDDVLN